MRADAVFPLKAAGRLVCHHALERNPYESLGHLPQSETSSAATERGSWALIPPLLFGDDSSPRANFIVLLDLHTACWSLNRLEAALLVRGQKESHQNVCLDLRMPMLHYRGGFGRYAEVTYPEINLVAWQEAKDA